MKNTLLLMKYDLILHGKSLWRVKWQFLFLFAFLGFLLFFAEKQPPKLFQIHYYNADESFSSKIVIDNFIKAIRPIAEIAEVESTDNIPQGDVFLYFPDNFAEMWQSFQKAPALIRIQSRNPLYQSLLKESFLAYENILLSSEAVISTYNNEMVRLNLPEEIFYQRNTEISLDFLALAFQRNDLLQKNPLPTFPAAFTKAYYFYSFSLLLVILLVIYQNALEIDRHKSYRRIFITSIRKTDYFIHSILMGILGCSLFLLLLWLLAKYLLHMEIRSSYWLHFFILQLALYLFFRIISTFFQRVESYYTLCLPAALLTALSGGGFVPLSFFPDTWLKLSKFSPFYQGMQYLLSKINGSTDYLPLICLNLCLLVFYFHKLRRARYA
ncbi:MAG: ABC transporter permease [Eubacteriales bacterium]|nr:ABC transporter permease [Eubacteriales bacterium]